MAVREALAYNVLSASISSTFGAMKRMPHARREQAN